MKTIQYSNTLFYYDGPQVFEARDIIGGHYIGIMVDPENGTDRYLVVGVPPEQLRRFRLGSLDLRSLVIETTSEEWFLATAPEGLGHPLQLSAQSTPLETSTLLPDDGFLLHDRIADEVAIREARLRNNLIFEIAAEPPEAALEHRIRVATLTGLLTHVQIIVKHAYGAALRQLPTDVRRSIEKTDAHMMDVVVPAAAGSFRVVFEAAARPDLLGQSELARALRCMDVLFENASDPDKALATVKAHRGHLVGAYLRFLRFLRQHKTGLRYSWAEPNSVRPSDRAISESQLGPLVDALSRVANLGSESLTLVGELERVNRGTKTWGLLTEDGLFSGEIREGGPSLDGLKVGGRYRFSCIEEIEETEATGQNNEQFT